MKFDRIIQNPPYVRNLHLKILAEAIKHLKDEKSVCVNLSPSQYLQDPLAKIKKSSNYTRFKDSVSKYISAFELYKKQEMSKSFSIAVNTDLAIYVCNKVGGFVYDNVRKYRGFDPICIYDRCKAKVGNSNLSEHIVNYANRTSENFVSALMIGGHNYRDIPSTDCLRRGNYGPFCNGKYNGKTIREIKESCKLSVWGNVDNWPVICFDTPDECVNFFNCTDTACYHLLSYAFTTDQHVPLRFLPWLGDAINPRTGLKGYQSEWTNEDIMLYFGITPEEQKVIEETMKKYETK